MANKHTLSPKSRWEQATDLLAVVVVRVLGEKSANNSLDSPLVPSIHEDTTYTRDAHARINSHAGGCPPDNVHP